MEDWVDNKALTKRLPALVCWHIWLKRNNLLFEGKGPSTWSVVHVTLNMLRNLPSGTKSVSKSLRVNSIFMINGYSVAFFTVLQWREVLIVGQVAAFFVEI